MFRSIQTAFAALAGASILAVIGALLVYVLVSGARTQDMVASNTRTLIEDMVEQRVTNLARYQASQDTIELAEPSEDVIWPYTDFAPVEPTTPLES